jgi:hypothetical protein
LAGLLAVKGQPGQTRRRPSLELDLASDIGDNQAVGGGFIGALPSSFAVQAAESRSKEQKAQQEIFTKIMMARMNSLEEGFRDVVHEMRDHFRHDDAGSGGGRGRLVKAGGRKERAKEKEADPPATADGDKKLVTPVSSSSQEMRAFAPSKPGTMELEKGRGEAQDSLGEAPAPARPVSH